MDTRHALSIALALLVPAGRGSGEEVDFAHEVYPLLKARCSRCHTAGTYEAGLSMDTRESLIRSGVVKVGRSAESELFRRVSSKDREVRMPPSGRALGDDEIALVRRWIDGGLPWDEGLTFGDRAEARSLRLRSPQVPAPRGSVSHPIDLVLLAYYREHDVEPPQPAGETEFVRRVSLDLIGLLPSPELVAEYLSSTDAEKDARLVDALLHRDVDYADHWLSFFNDLLRNDYQGTGYIDGGRKQITSWLYRSLRDNKPYDEFVRELIDPTAESEGFLKGIKWRGRVNASQVPALQFSQNVAQVMLGINLKCASCHDSFIDQWKLADAYGLAAVASEEPLEIHRCDKPTGVMATPAFLFPELGTIDPELPREERLKRLAELMTHRDNGRFARTIVNRLWQRLLGRGIVEPVDVLRNPPFSDDLLELLASRFVESGYDLKSTLRLIATSRAYRARAVDLDPDRPRDEFVFRGPALRRMTAEQFVDAVWAVTGTIPEKIVAAAGDRGGRPPRASLLAADALMRSLGRPNREQVISMRPEELTTLQALDLTNGTVLAGLLERGSAGLAVEMDDADSGELVARLYQRALSRAPMPAELEVAREIVGSPPAESGIADLLWSIFMLPEFQLIR